MQVWQRLDLGELRGHVAVLRPEGLVSDQRHAGAARDGLRCLAGQNKRFSVRVADANGMFDRQQMVAASGGLITPGSTWHCQCWYRDTNLPCGDQQNFTNGLSLTFVP